MKPVYESILKIIVKMSSLLVPYALDEPSLGAKLSISVFEEMSETYDVMVLSRNLPRLYYQNAIYIAIGTTFYA